MAPALTAEPLSPKEKLTSTASPSARSSSSDSGAVAGGGTGGAGPGSVAKKPSTPTPATATTRVTRSREAAAVAAAAAAAAAGGLASSPAATIPQLRSSQPNNKRKSGGNKPSNEPAMGLSTAPTPHSSSSSASAGPSTPDAGVASTSASPAVVEKNNNSSSNTTNTHSSSPKDNSTAQLLADLTINFEEAISAEICLRKTLPEVSLGKEPATTPAAATSSSSTTESPGVSGEAAAEDQSIPAEEELSKIETDNIEERLSQLDGNVIAMSEELLPPPPEPEPPTTPSRQQQTPVNPAQDSPRLQATPQQQQLTPQSTAGSINFLKDGAAGAVLEDQDIEEVLKALKTFDGAHVNPDAICDFFNEVWEEAPPAASMSATAAPASSAPELPDIKPNFSGTSILPSTSSLSTANVSVKQERPWEESHAELEQQQHVITRRIDFLLRRMRKFQARQMCRHASGEVAGILEWSARSSHKTPNPARSATLSEREATVLSIVSGRPDCAFWEEQKKHPLPASQMSSVIRHIGTAARHQQICHTATGTSATLAPSSSWFNSSNSTTLPGKRPRKNQLDTTPGAGTAAAAGLSATGAAAVMTGSSTDPNTPRADDIVPGYDTYVTSELTHVAGLLHTELREVQNAIDSDATESSSGGESADEMVTYNNTQQQSLPIARRAVWRYSKDRAAIALRWSWVCSQLADLEMKIRQYNDLHVELSHSKGEVRLEATVSQSASPANGLKEEPPSDMLCSRARPLVLSEFRKRKLFQTTNMHTISKKAARPSNIKCGCQWPQVPCTLCTGRTDPTAPRELVETMMPANRVALIDAGYHPVLSFASDVSQSVHLEAVARQPDWQYRVMRSQAKAIVKAMWKAERETLASGGSGGHAGSRRPGDAVKRRYIRRKERNNNSNKEAGSGALAAGGGGGSGVGGGDSGNGTAAAATGRKQQQQQHPTGVNNSRSQWPDSRQRQRQRHQSPSSTSISAHSGAKKSRKSTNNNSSCNSIQQQQSSGSNINNHHLNGYGDQWGSEQSSSRSRRNSSPTHSHRNERSSERRIRPIYDIDNIVIPYSMAAQTKVEILPYKEIPTPKWRIVDSDSDKAKQSADESAECKLSNGSVPATATSDELSNTRTNALHPPQEQKLLDEQPPKVNGISQKETVVKHNNNNIVNNNNNNNKNGLVNGNAKTAEPKAAAAKQHKVEKKEEKGKKPKLNGNISKNLNAKTAEHLAESTAEIEPPLPKRLKLDKSADEVTKPKANGQAKAPLIEMEEEEYNEEDLSDEAFIARHQRALLEERRRFETFLKFPWSTRSRANRRADSRAESSGANTPDPASPAPHHGGTGADNESIPSPLAHPLEGFNESGELLMGGQSRKARRRTTSSKLKDQTERRSTTPDLRESHALMQQPSLFEPLVFPLSEEVYQHLLAETYATPASIPSTKRAKTKSVSSNCDGSSFTGAGGSSGSRRSSKSKTKLNNGQINGHPMAAKIDVIEDEIERVALEGDGGLSEPEEEDVLLEVEDDDYPKHHLAPLDDEQESTPDAELNLYDSAIDAYLGDQEALEEDMAEDPFEDDDPNDPEWKNRTDGSRSRRI
ncbi:pneumococcal serine-rich repeat protein isoform X3 [Drosophila kikkawai]|uniref:Pneumococcal serine-rich repeat protein isoform X3 n=1 Tax=Drosophila kikkawai TaxID=30033 RepID=A0ABM4GKE9_DROKI